MRVTIVILSIFTGTLLGLAAVQTDQNRAIKQRCDLRTHKLVYIKNAIVDQVICVKPENKYLIQYTM